MLGTLGEVTSVAAERFGDRTALVCQGQDFTFREVDAMAAKVANGLTAKGIEPGDRVSIYAGNCWEWLIAYYGIAKTGAVINPVNVMLTPEEVGYVTRDCGARAIIASGDKGEALSDIRADTPLEDIILFGDEHVAGTTSFGDLLAGGANHFETPPIDPKSLAKISYTSGTTGHPKGAQGSHRAAIVNAAITSQMHARTAHDTFITALPCAHAYGAVVQLASFLLGAKLVVIPRFSEIEVLDAIQEHRGTMFDGVPTAFMMLCAHPEIGNYDLSSVTRMAVGGQTMPAAKAQEVQERFDAPLLELWGMTELAGLGTTHALYAENKLGSIGVSIPYYECRIADPDDSTVTLENGEVGELVVRGPSVMLGYFNNEEATRDTIDADGWLRTGDLASRDDEGYFYMVDRKKDMILTGGYNIYPAEIERVLAGHPSVAMSAVGRVADDMKGELAKAYIVLRPGAAATDEEIVNFCRSHLAAYKVPRLIKFVEALPTTSTGKILRRELATLDAETAH